MIFSIGFVIYLYIIQNLNNYVKNINRNINKNIYYFLIFLFSWLVLESFRIYLQSFFPDIENYKELFNNTPDIFAFINSDESWFEFFNFNVELGFSILISLFKVVTSSFSVFLFFISLFELSALYYFCKKYSLSIYDVAPICAALTFTTFQIGMLRQALAFCFFLIALMYVQNKIKYLLLILLATTFHTSALLCLFLFWVDKYIDKRIYLLIFIFSVVLYLFKVDLLNFSISYFDILDSISGTRTGFYLNVDRQNNYLGIGFWERVILFIVMFIINVDKAKDKHDRLSILLFNLGMASILLQLILFSSPTITSRLRYYLVIFPLIYISLYIHKSVKSNLKWVYQLLFLFYLLSQAFVYSSYLL